MGEATSRRANGRADAVTAERLAAAFDPRLADVWVEVFASGVDVPDRGAYLACFLRMAYLRGYEDGLCEADRGSLFTSLGLSVPSRRTATHRRERE